MKSWIWLRVASGIYALFAVLHGIDFIGNPEGPPEARTLTEAMKNFRFVLMGSHRSAWDFFRGFDLLFIANLAILAAVLWLLSYLARVSPAQAGPIVSTLFIGSCLLTAICWSKFFLAAWVLTALAALALGVATAGLRRSKQGNSY